MASFNCLQHLCLNKNNRLRRRDLKTPSAAHILAHQHIVNANHIVTRRLVLDTFVLVQISRRLFFLSSRHPANVVIRALAAMRAGHVRCFDFLFFVKNIAFVHTSIVSDCGIWGNKSMRKPAPEQGVTFKFALRAC